MKKKIRQISFFTSTAVSIAVLVFCVKCFPRPYSVFVFDPRIEFREQKNEQIGSVVNRLDGLNIRPCKKIGLFWTSFVADTLGFGYLTFGAINVVVVSFVLSYFISKLILNKIYAQNTRN